MKSNRRRSTGRPSRALFFAFVATVLVSFGRPASADPVVDFFRTNLLQTIPHDFFAQSLTGNGKEGIAQDRLFLVNIFTAGFAELPSAKRMTLLQGLTPLIQGSKTGEAMAHLLGALGPGYVKLGQVLGNRPDLVRKESDRDELIKLAEAAPAIELSAVRKVVEAELKKPLEQVFRKFDPIPIGVGSIGQVHRAELMDGTPVVVKVIKPGAEGALVRNMTTIEKGSEGTGQLAKALKPVIAEIKRISSLEADLRYEAAAIKRAEINFANRPEENVPVVNDQLSTSNILVESVAEGRAVTEMGFGMTMRRKQARGVFNSILTQVFLYGDFHADPHKGNIFADSRGRRTYIDWGLSSTISYTQRGKLLLAAGALESGNDTLTLKALQGLGQNTIAEKSLLKVIGEVRKSSSEPAERLQNLMIQSQVEGLVLSPQLILAGKALFQAEGVAKKLDPNFNSAKALQHFATDTALHGLNMGIRSAKEKTDYLLRKPRSVARKLNPLRLLRRTPRH